MGGEGERKYPLNKPAGFVPPIQRYSARLPPDVTTVKIAYLGMQYPDTAAGAAKSEDFLRDGKSLCALRGGPEHVDVAGYVDPEGYPTSVFATYWKSPEQFDTWRSSRPVSNWWNDPAKLCGEAGYFIEAMDVPRDYFETNKFREYVRGLAACPMSRLEPMDESGYWGAARDRIPASAYDRLAASHEPALRTAPAIDTRGCRLRITPPKNFVVIRSGVSWEDCGREQLDSYNANIAPKLDLGMDFLRRHPIETGCYSLRHMDVISDNGAPAKESYALGFFASLSHLESWAKQHPTHLAIYTRAMAERKKYGGGLELRTYHEIYVLPEDGGRFDYVNCHPKTGLLPFFAASHIA